jgi:adenylate cyclase
VLVGAVLSLTDRHRTPLAIIDDGDMGRMPGVIVQAHAISQLLEGRTTPRPGLFGIIALTGLAALVGIMLSLLRQGIAVKLALAAGVIGLYWLTAIFGFAQGLPLLPMLAPTIAFLAALWMMDLLIGRAESKQREYIQGMFARYVSPAVVDQLVANPSAARITGERREATFIFTDIANFTGLTERLDPQLHANMLNRYLNGACDIILRHGGTIDKFIGDAIMVIFNAPLQQPDHAARAVKCALELDEFAEIFRKDRNREGIPLGVTRIGIHTGVATIGNFGSDARTEFTALGDTVNIASRVEGANKTFGTRICCTGDVVEKCPDLEFLPVGEAILRGKSQSVTLWLPVSGDTGAEFASQYRSAFSQLSAGDQKVKTRFAELVEQKPGDPLLIFHLKRMEAGTVSTLVTMDD